MANEAKTKECRKIFENSYSSELVSEKKNVHFLISICCKSDLSLIGFGFENTLVSNQHS